LAQKYPISRNHPSCEASKKCGGFAMTVEIKLDFEPWSGGRVSAGGEGKVGGHGGSVRASAELLWCLGAHRRAAEPWECSGGWKPKGLLPRITAIFGNACTP